jgi:hypothetical protein
MAGLDVSASGVSIRAFFRAGADREAAAGAAAVTASLPAAGSLAAAGSSAVGGAAFLVRVVFRFVPFAAAPSVAADSTTTGESDALPRVTTPSLLLPSSLASHPVRKCAAVRRRCHGFCRCRGAPPRHPARRALGGRGCPVSSAVIGRDRGCRGPVRSGGGGKGDRRFHAKSVPETVRFFRPKTNREDAERARARARNRRSNKWGAVAASGDDRRTASASTPLTSALLLRWRSMVLATTRNKPKWKLVSGRAQTHVSRAALTGTHNRMV